MRSKPRPDFAWSTEERDGEVDEMNAGRRERADRRELRREAPIVERQREKFLLAEIALHEQRLSELSRGEPAAEITDGGFEAALVPDSEHQAGFRDGLQRAFGLRPRGTERLFAEDMLAGARGRNDLLGVEAVRRAENHRIDVRPGKCIGIFRRHREGLGHCRAWPRFGINAEHDADALGSSKFAHDRAPPPAETDHSGANHRWRPGLSALFS